MEKIFHHGDTENTEKQNSNMDSQDEQDKRGMELSCISCASMLDFIAGSFFSALRVSVVNPLLIVANDHAEK
jgi:hypothetical protein